MKSIHILGPGALGCLWASKLADTHFVNMIVKKHHPWLDDANEQPQQTLICQPGDQVKTIHAQTLNTTDEISCLILATKAYDALTAVQSVQHRLAKHANIILLQNGMGSQQQIAEHFTQHSIYACSSTEGAYKTDFKTVVHAGQGESRIGALTASASQSALECFLPAEFFVWDDQIEQALWRKLLINAAINPLTVIHHCRNGELLQQPQALNHLKQICNELDKVNEALNVQSLPVFDIASEVAKKTANNFSSMYQDSEQGRPTEIHFITGYLVNQAEKLGVSCPENKKILQQLS